MEAKKWCCGEKMASIGLLALRLAVGAIFIYHGWDKIQNIDMVAGFFSKMFPAGAFLAWLVAIVEFIGGIAVVLGVFTKEVAKLLAIIMIVAIFSAHWGQGFKAMEFPLSLLGGSLALAGLGAGPWRLIKREGCGGGKTEGNCCGDACKHDHKN